MNKPVCLMIDIEKIDLLKKIARSKSVTEEKDVVYTDLIREAIELFILTRCLDSEDFT